MNPFFTGLAALVVLLAGCTGAPAKPAASTTPSTVAAEPSVDADTGSLAGTVTDDELQPLAAVRASIVEKQLEEKTDAKGRFTFNGVPPGTYKLIVEALGYETQGKKVTVLAGETANASFRLKPLAIASEPYHVSVPRVSLIQLSNSALSIVANYSAVCGSCFHTLDFEPIPKQVLVENEWTATEVGPINNQVDIWWRYYDSSGGYHNKLNTYNNRQGIFASAAEVAALDSTKVGRFNITVEGSILSVEQRVTTWHTFAYAADLPEGFSALSPA